MASRKLAIASLPSLLLISVLLVVAVVVAARPGAISEEDARSGHLAPPLGRAPAAPTTNTKNNDDRAAFRASSPVSCIDTVAPAGSAATPAPAPAPHPPPKESDDDTLTFFCIVFIILVIGCCLDRLCA